MIITIDYETPFKEWNDFGLPDDRPPCKGMAQLNLDKVIIRQTPSTTAPLPGNQFQDHPSHAIINAFKEGIGPGWVNGDVWMLRAMLELPSDVFPSAVRDVLMQDPTEKKVAKGGLVFFCSTTTDTIGSGESWRRVHGMGYLRDKGVLLQKPFRLNTVFWRKVLVGRDQGKSKVPLLPEFCAEHIGAIGPNVWWLFYPVDALVPCS
jgi:hypothetical protein